MRIYPLLSIGISPPFLSVPCPENEPTYLQKNKKSATANFVIITTTTTKETNQHKPKKPHTSKFPFSLQLEPTGYKLFLIMMMMIIFRAGWIVSLVVTAAATMAEEGSLPHQSHQQQQQQLRGVSNVTQTYIPKVFGLLIFRCSFSRLCVCVCIIGAI